MRRFMGFGRGGGGLEQTADAVFKANFSRTTFPPTFACMSLSKLFFFFFLKVGVLTGVFVVVLAVNLLKGGGAFTSPLGIECGSYAFWGATVFIFVWVLAVSL